LESRTARGACASCGTREFDTGEIIVAPPVSYDSDGRPHIGEGQPALPMVQVICRNCGRIALFQAGMIGLVPKRPRLG
jgi:predicted nucleic-acid-binding Zn-ribbon protein